jgi:hypothetical protein
MPAENIGRIKSWKGSRDGRDAEIKDPMALPALLA